MGSPNHLSPYTALENFQRNYNWRRESQRVIKLSFEVKLKISRFVGLARAQWRGGSTLSGGGTASFGVSLKTVTVVCSTACCGYFKVIHSLDNALNFNN